MVGRRLILLCMLCLLGGCGRPAPSEAEAERLRAAVAAETGNTNTLLYIDHGEIQIRSGSNTLTFNQMPHQARPESLARDIVLPPDAQIDLWSKGPRGQTLSCLSGKTSEDCAAFFRDEWVAQGWQLLSDVQTDKRQGLSFQKTGQRVSITLEPAPNQLSAIRILLFIETVPDGG
jgi:hypothetical protein